MSLFLSRPMGVPTHSRMRLNTKSPHARGLEAVFPEFGGYRGVNALTGQVATTIEGIGGAPVNATKSTPYGIVPHIPRGGDDWDTGYHGGAWAGDFTPVNRNGSGYGTITAWVWMQGDGDTGWASEWYVVSGMNVTMTANQTSGNGSFGVAWNAYSQRWTTCPLPIRNRWWFVASAIDGAGMRLYMSDEFGTEATSTDAMNWSGGAWSQVHVGGPSQGFRRFGGVVMDIRRYNYKLSLTQLRELASPITRWDLYRV